MCANVAGMGWYGGTAEVDGLAEMESLGASAGASIVVGGGAGTVVGAGDGRAHAAVSSGAVDITSAGITVWGCTRWRGTDGWV